MKLNYLFLMLLVGFFVVACGDEDPMDTCDTSGMTYDDDIASIFNTSCATTDACHGANSPVFAMNDYTSSKAAADFGRIVGSLNHTDGFKPMPYPEPSTKIDSCDILKITQWIADGAPE